MKNTLEILAPAGDTDMLRAAVFSGADCVYLGVKGFNARRGAANFDGDGLAGAVAFCHARNCGVYAAVNTLALPGREAELQRAILAAADAGCDAVIVQDLAAAAIARAVAPQLALHASTQMSVHSAAGVEKLAELGFSRVILARELSEEEIARIAEASPIQLEVFVHGALCVSVSGQCYASAFLGGRSANRGACAGTCRLPFYACEGNAPATPAPAGEDAHHLSLKDLSILDALPRLAQLGVVSAKIEGRLRGPEYCAVVVDAAKKSLNNEAYDREILQNVFSRSGFTDGWFTGQNDEGMFGARTGADTAAAKATLPKARELYRRERPRVPVRMELAFDEKGGSLAVSDGAHELRREIPGPLPAAQKDAAPALRAALEKTGGTPFYTEDAAVETGGAFFPAAEAGRLRRELLEELLALRGQPSTAGKGLPHAAGIGIIFGADGEHGGLKNSLHRVGSGSLHGVGVGVAHGALDGSWKKQAEAWRHKNGRPLLRARFENVKQMPENASEICGMLVLPLAEADAVPEALRAKTLLWLPRTLFGEREARAKREVERTRHMGFAGFQIGNIAHAKLCEGLPMHADFGLNAANALAVELLCAMGCGGVTLSPELSFAQMRDIQGVHPCTDAICYGHMPLMLTRACPIKLAKAGGCTTCGREGNLVDRKGAAFPVRCRDGMRQIYNPVPLWMADRLQSWPADTATLYFTTETKKEAGAVLDAFAEGHSAKGPFTRSLYDKGSEG